MRFKPFSHKEAALDPSTREEILNVAQKVFALTGFKEATVRQICKAAKANVCLISYYFGGKDGLYKAIFERVGQSRWELVQNQLGDMTNITSREEYYLRLKMFLENMYKEMSSKPDFFKLMHREMNEGMPRAEEVIKKFIGNCLGLFEEFLEYGKKKKFIKKEINCRFAGLAIINMYLGFIAQHATRPDFFFQEIPDEEISQLIMKTITSIFFNGVTQ